MFAYDLHGLSSAALRPQARTQKLHKCPQINYKLQKCRNFWKSFAFLIYLSGTLGTLGPHFSPKRQRDVKASTSQAAPACQVTKAVVGTSAFLDLCASVLDLFLGLPLCWVSGLQARQYPFYISHPFCSGGVFIAYLFYIFLHFVKATSLQIAQSKPPFHSVWAQFVCAFKWTLRILTI